MQLKKRRYVPDLTSQMAVAEANYHRLQRLMGDFDQWRSLAITLQQGEATTQLHLTIVERFNYTMTMEVQLGTAKQWWLQPLHLRLYHDMRMAEVVKSDDYRQYRGSYGYPNDQGVMADEKAQLNNYLALLLQQALQHGTQLQKQPLQKMVAAQ